MQVVWQDHMQVFWNGQGLRQAALGKPDSADGRLGVGLEALLCSFVQTFGWPGDTTGAWFSEALSTVWCWYVLSVAASQCSGLEAVGMRKGTPGDSPRIIVPRETIPGGGFFRFAKLQIFR